MELQQAQTSKQWENCVIHFAGLVDRYEVNVPQADEAAVTDGYLRSTSYLRPL